MEPSDEYFESYSDLEVHKLMLSDHARNEAYRSAICDHPEIFKGKVVLDLGTGTGFLAILCAKAGASKVYAVEASDMAELAVITTHENQVAETVQVIQSKIEDTELPEKVDIIVSEWMGFYLLHESMLDSVIFARDKFLKPNGLMYPNKCILYTGPCYSPDIFKFWEDISGVSMQTIGQLYSTKYKGKPEIMPIDKDFILTKSSSVLEFDTKTVQLADLNNISSKIHVTCERSGDINIIGLWFDVYFPHSNVILSTSPSFKQTHWKQTAIILPMEKSVTKDEKVSYRLEINKNRNCPRHYDIELSILDPEEDQNPQPKTIDEKKEAFYKVHNADSDYEEYNSDPDDD